jgi:hypothetical protein
VCVWVRRFSAKGQKDNPRGARKSEEYGCRPGEAVSHAKVLGEADVSRVQISAVESKMLYFTEVHPSPAVIREGNAEFERHDDAGE